MSVRNWIRKFSPATVLTVLILSRFYADLDKECTESVGLFNPISALETLLALQVALTDLRLACRFGHPVTSTEEIVTTDKIEHDCQDNKRNDA